MDANYFNVSLNENVHKCADMLERIHYDLEAMKPEAKPEALELNEPRDEKKAKFQSYLKNGLQGEDKRHEVLFSSKTDDKPTGILNTNLKFAARMYYAIMQAIGGDDTDISAMVPMMSTYDTTERTVKYRVKVIYDSNYFKDSHIIGFQPEETYLVTISPDSIAKTDDFIFKVERD